MSIRCGPGECRLTCSGLGSCQDGSSVLCTDAELCAVDCSSNACTNLNLACEDSELCQATCQGGGNNICSGAAFRCQRAEVCEFDCNDAVAVCE
jgi:hypothetical protein